jgi:hypothetical protein
MTTEPQIEISACKICHAGMRAFDEEPSHSKTPDAMSRTNSNQLSCTSSHLPRHRPRRRDAIICDVLEKRAVALPNPLQAPLVERRFAGQVSSSLLA